MIVDTSAIVAILREEPDAARYVEALGRAASVRISTGTYVETAIVIDSARDPVLSGRLDDLLATVRARVEPVTRRHADLARHAFRVFGKGAGHPADLNFGDCVAYALAREADEPLLFKGDDFSKTDVADAFS